MTLTRQNEVAEGLNKLLARQSLSPVSNLQLLTGGANMELWSFDSGTFPMVLRRYRNGQPHEGAEEKFSIASEAEVVRYAEKAQIKAPRVIGILETEDGLGPGYVMSRIEGESLPSRLFRNEKYSDALNSLTQELGTELAKIHALDIPKHIAETKLPGTLLANVEDIFKQVGYISPIISMALCWLEDNLPSDERDTCFLHGDIRMGNVLVTENGLSAVLDWELVHFGLPEEDVAYICMPSWRFGRYEKTAAGVGSLDDLITAYETAGGQKIDREIVNWYLVYSSLNWGATTALMAHWWREGEDRSLERILVGTRISEVEIDLLLMLENILGVSQAEGIEFEVPAPPSRGGDVSPAELTEAAIDYLSNQVVPESAGAAKFHARIAANALSIAQRLIEHGSEFESGSAGRLKEIGYSHEALCEALRAGDVRWQSMPGLISHLRLSCLERISMHQPKYAARDVALKKWRK